MTSVIDGLRFALGPEAAILTLAAIGLNLHMGFTGIINLGQAGYMMLGAFGVAIPVAIFGMPLLFGFACAIVLSLLWSALLGLPTLRLRADYFAVTSLALAETARLVADSRWAAPLTGSVQGIQGFAKEFYSWNPIPRGDYGLGSLVYTENQVWMAAVAWGSVLLGTLLVWAIARSPWGRVIVSIRDDEFVPATLGKNVYRFRLQSLVIGGLFGSVAGLLMALNQQDVHASSYLPTLGFFATVAIMLGGMGKVIGPVVGTITFWFIIAFTDSALRAWLTSGDGAPNFLKPLHVASARFVIAGVMLCLLIAFRPGGLLGGAGARIFVAGGKRGA